MYGSYFSTRDLGIRLPRQLEELQRFLRSVSSAQYFVFQPNTSLVGNLHIYWVVETTTFSTDGCKRAKCQPRSIALYHSAKLRGSGSAEQLRPSCLCRRAPNRKKGHRSADQSHQVGILRIHGRDSWSAEHARNRFSGKV